MKLAKSFFRTEMPCFLFHAVAGFFISPFSIIARHHTFADPGATNPSNTGFAKYMAAWTLVEYAMARSADSVGQM
jgi:hypothetical protein